MRGNPHVRFGPEAAGKGPAPCRHLAGVLPVPSGTPISVRRSSRSAPTVRGRSRSGSTATSGPNAKPAQAGIGFAELSNGFADTDDPAALQAICDRLGPGTINVFFQRWLARLPLPLTPHDRDAGYWWELSMAQIEVSRTLVLTQPRYARGFFEALVADNLDLGRPDTIEIIFDRPDPRRQARHRRRVPNQGGHPRHRGHRQRLLQALPHQAIPERRACAADRDRDQRSQRPGLPTPPAQSRRAADQSPCGQRSGIAG